MFHEALVIFTDIMKMDMFRYTWGTLSVSLVILLMAMFVRYRKIQNRQPKKHQQIKEIYHSIKAAAVFAVLGVTFYFIFGDPKMQFDTPIAGYWIALQVLGFLVVHDAYFYWSHRLIHHPKLYKLTHHVHHISKTPTPFTAYSFSIFEAGIQAIFFVVIEQFFPIHFSALFIYLNILMLKNAVGHCGFELYPSWIFKTPLKWITTVTHHDLHHDKFKYNFALHFTWWDKMCGTEAPNYEQRFVEVTTKPELDLKQA